MTDATKVGERVRAHEGDLVRGVGEGSTPFCCTKNTFLPLPATHSAFTCILICTFSLRSKRVLFIKHSNRIFPNILLSLTFQSHLLRPWKVLRHRWSSLHPSTFSGSKLIKNTCEAWVPQPHLRSVHRPEPTESALRGGFLFAQAQRWSVGLFYKHQAF